MAASERVRMTSSSVGKAAVATLTRALALDHGRDGIRANCIMPGPVYTPMAYSGGMSDELCERRCIACCTRSRTRAGTSVGPTVFLASDEARDVTGVIPAVDGNVTVRGPDR